jgi:hypothetical protein
MIKIGKLDLKDKIVISDPCYCDFDNPWIKQLKIVPGEYNCFVEYTEDETRVSSMLLTNKKTNDKKIDEEIAYVGVDSGTIAIFTLEKYEELVKMKKNYEEKFDEYYLKLTSKTFLEFNECMASVYDNIFVSSTGYGDGDYIVYVKRDKEEHITALKIIFIYEEECEDE